VSELVVRSQGRSVAASSLASSDEEETLTASLGAELQPGPATAVYTFTGVLNDKLRGFYRSKYTVNGEDRWVPFQKFSSVYLKFEFATLLIYGDLYGILAA